LDNQPMKPNLR